MHHKCSISVMNLSLPLHFRFHVHLILLFYALAPSWKELLTPFRLPRNWKECKMEINEKLQLALAMSSQQGRLMLCFVTFMLSHGIFFHFDRLLIFHSTSFATNTCFEVCFHVLMPTTSFSGIAETIQHRKSIFRGRATCKHKWFVFVCRFSCENSNLKHAKRVRVASEQAGLV